MRNALSKEHAFYSIEGGVTGRFHSSIKKDPQTAPELPHTKIKNKLPVLHENCHRPPVRAWQVLPPTRAVRRPRGRARLTSRSIVAAERLGTSPPAGSRGSRVVCRREGSSRPRCGGSGCLEVSSGRQLKSCCVPIGEARNVPAWDECIHHMGLIFC